MGFKVKKKCNFANLKAGFLVMYYSLTNWSFRLSHLFHTEGVFLFIAMVNNAIVSLYYTNYELFLSCWNLQ